MTQESAITPEMRAAVGVESEPHVNEVEKGAIIKFRGRHRGHEPYLHRRTGGTELEVRRDRSAADVLPYDELRPDESGRQESILG